MPRKKTADSADQTEGEIRSEGVGGRSDARDRSTADALLSRVSASDHLIAEIRYWHRQRCFAMAQRIKLDNALGAFLRMMLGWSRDLPEGERKKIADAAAKVIKNPDGSEWAQVIAASKAAATPFEAVEDQALKRMQELARSLPVWSRFGASVKGFGAGSLAVIVGEAGDLSNYANPARLWKRMGVGIVDGIRQGGLRKTASADEWIAHGYNRQRRSRLYVIGVCLIRTQNIYRDIYLERKAYELIREPAMKPIHAHLRAQRYMEKRLLRDLWRAWRARSMVPPKENMPAEIQPALEPA